MVDDPLIGKELDEYHIDSLMGGGKMALIYKATDTRLGREAAIKVIMTGFQHDPEYRERFQREAKAIARLEHPHIVQLYRYGEALGVLYMAMKFIEGASMATVLASYKADGEYIEAEEASRIVREICQALDYAHEEGVIHRDIKPENIMLNKQGRAILTDFGLVLIQSDGTRGGVLGTPHYLAPEQAMSSANAVAQSDIYSMGIVIYQMFTNVRPYEGDKPIEVAMMHITQQPAPPSRHRAVIGPELEAVILKAIAKKTQDRYQSATELADALDAALAAHPLPSKQAPPKKTTRRTTRSAAGTRKPTTRKTARSTSTTSATEKSAPTEKKPTTSQRKSTGTGQPSSSSTTKTPTGTAKSSTPRTAQKPTTSTRSTTSRSRQTTGTGKPSSSSTTKKPTGTAKSPTPRTAQKPATSTRSSTAKKPAPPKKTTTSRPRKRTPSTAGKDEPKPETTDSDAS